MEEKAVRAGIEMETPNAQNRPLADERSQHSELPSDLQTTARLDGMTESGGNGDNASEAAPESSKIFTMLGNPPPRSMILQTYLEFMAIRKQSRGHE